MSEIVTLAPACFISFVSYNLTGFFCGLSKKSFPLSDNSHIDPKLSDLMPR
jgi:hypothetical protein